MSIKSTTRKNSHLLQTMDSFSACKHNHLSPKGGEPRDRRNKRRRRHEQNKRGNQKSDVTEMVKCVRAGVERIQIAGKRKGREERGGGRGRWKRGGGVSWPDVQLTGRIRGVTVLMSDLMTQHGLNNTSCSHKEWRHTHMRTLAHTNIHFSEIGIHSFELTVCKRIHEKNAD